MSKDNEKKENIFEILDGVMIQLEEQKDVHDNDPNYSNHSTNCITCFNCSIGFTI